MLWFSATEAARERKRDQKRKEVLQREREREESERERKQSKSLSSQEGPHNLKAIRKTYFKEGNAV